MKTQTLTDLFTSFLETEKGYPQNSFVHNSRIPFDKLTTKPVEVDLFIVDEKKSYLACVEFKAANNAMSRYVADAQIKVIRDIIDNPVMPAYVVMPKGESDFEIYAIDEIAPGIIEKKNFPSYEEMQRSVHSDAASLLSRTVRRMKGIDRLSKTSGWISVLSVAVGVSVTIIANIYTVKSDKPKEKVESLVTNYIDSLSKDMASIKSRLEEMNVKDTQAMTKNLAIASLEDRMRTFESVVSNDPSKLLKIQQITNEMARTHELLAKEKEITDLKLVNLKERVDQLMNWIFGLMATLLTSIVGYILTTLKKNSMR